MAEEQNAGVQWLWLPKSDPACYGAGLAVLISRPEDLAGPVQGLRDAEEWMMEHAEDVEAAPAYVRNALRSMALPVLLPCVSVDLEPVEMRVNAQDAGMSSFDGTKPCLLDADEAKALLEIKPEDADWDSPEFMLCPQDGTQKPSLGLSVRIPALGDAEQCGWNVSDIALDDLRELLDPLLKQAEAQDEGPRP